MKPAAKRRAVLITETAVMTALLIAVQAATKPFGQYVTGSCVNAVLGLTGLAAGLWSGITVAVLSPFFAFLLGIGPQLMPITPLIAAGNVVFVLLLSLLANRSDLPLWRKLIALVTAAAAKFAVLYVLVVKILCNMMALPEAQVATFTAMFSYPQLITALVGGAVALLIAPTLKRALKRYK